MKSSIEVFTKIRKILIWIILVMNLITLIGKGFLNSLLTKYIPIRQITEKKLKRKAKPWITKGILKSMTIRDRFLMNYINAKNA